MKIMNYKRKCIIFSIYIIIVGAVLSILGLGLSGFDINKLKITGSRKWYRTIDFDFENNQYDYGLTFVNKIMND